MLVRLVGRTTISVPVAVLSTRSIAKPEGTSAAAQNRWFMMPILHEKSAAHALQFHQN
jgi:hypothetical protein